MTPQEFDELVSPFLEAQDDQYSSEFDNTPHERATDVVRDLRNFLFHAEIDKEERRKQYLALKAEFEPYL